jgi:MFS family permease
MGTPREKQRPSGLRLAIQLNLFALSLTALWNPLNSLVLPGLVTSFVSGGVRGSALGLLTFLGIGFAVVIQPIAGVTSDGWRHRQRRRVYIFVGSAVMVGGLIAIAGAQAFWWLVLAYVAVQFGGNIAQAAFQALIPDQVREQNRGKASGVKTGFDLAGTVIGLGIAGGIVLLGAGDRVVVLALAAAVVLGAAAVWRWVPPSPVERSESRSARPNPFVRAFQPLWSGSPAFKLALWTRFLFLLGLYPVQRFLLYYLEDRFQLEDPVGPASVAIGTAVIAGAIAAAGAGFLADRLGQKFVLYPSIALAAIGVAGLGALPGIWLAAAAGLLVAVGAGAFQAVNWAAIAEEVPEGQGARYFGVANITTAGASAAAGLLGPLVDVVRSVAPFATYLTTFSLAAAITLAALVPLRRTAAPA